MDKILWPIVAVFGIIIIATMGTIIIMDDIRCKCLNNIHSEFEKL